MDDKKIDRSESEGNKNNINGLSGIELKAEGESENKKGNKKENRKEDKKENKKEKKNETKKKKSIKEILSKKFPSQSAKLISRRIIQRTKRLPFKRSIH